MAPEWAATIFSGVLGNLLGLFGPASRLYFPYLLTAIGFAVIAYVINRKRLKADGETSFFSYLFKPAAYLTASSLVDVKIVLFNRAFVPFLALANRAATVASAALVAGLLLGSGAEEAFEASKTNGPDLGFAALTLITISVTVASDFTSYWVHRIHHENPIFWPFHKVHHSAETLTPLTVLRKHPVYDFIRALSNAFIVGPVQGIVFAMFGVNDVLVILGVNALYAVFHWTGSNLRHMHVWLSYGPVVSRILISPAQHQIHHSCAAPHQDKNYGELFALWDWIFGTLYVPAGYEALQYGVADKQGQALPQPHPTLKDAYLAPFKESAEAFRQRSRRDDANNKARATL